MRIRRVRFIGRLCLAVAAALIALVTISRGREIGVRSADGAFVAIGNGCVQAGVNRDRFGWAAPELVLGPAYAMRNWHDDWTLAWRPFHVRRGPNQRFFVAPLWLPLVMVLAAGAYATGVMAGVRVARSRGCLACGYSLEGSPDRNGAVTCPECGTVRPSSP